MVRSQGTAYICGLSCAVATTATKRINVAAIRMIVAIGGIVVNCRGHHKSNRNFQAAW